MKIKCLAIKTQKNINVNLIKRFNKNVIFCEDKK